MDFKEICSNKGNGTKTSSQFTMPRTSKTVVKASKADNEGDCAIKIEDSSSSTDELPPPPPPRRNTSIPKKKKRPRSSASSSSDVPTAARASGARSSSSEPAPKREAKNRGRHERVRPHVHRHGDPHVQHLIDTRELRYVIRRYKGHRQDILKRLNELEISCCCSGCRRQRDAFDK